MSSADETRRNTGNPPGGEPSPSGKPQARPGNGGEPARPKEIGGPAGPDPTRYGDWERKGRCIDF